MFMSLAVHNIIMIVKVKTLGLIAFLQMVKRKKMDGRALEVMVLYAASPLHNGGPSTH